MILITAILIIVGAVVSYFWVKLVFAIYNYVVSRRNSNPYINAERIKAKNDKDYEDYLKWMSKHGKSVPISKLKTREEHVAESKINSLFR